MRIRRSAGVLFFSFFAFFLGKLIENLNPSFSLGFVKLLLVKNTGASFNLFSNAPFVANLISALIIVPLFYFLLSKKLNKKLVFPFVLLTAGAMSNLLERLIFGYAVDYISVFNFPVFNLADIFITLSCLYIGLRLIIYRDDIYEANN